MSTVEGGKIVTFGLRPDHASEDYGYILPGQKLNESPAYAVAAFVKKPDIQTGERYLTDGYLWNSGNFMFRADVMISEIAHFEPEIAAAAKQAVSEGKSDYDFFCLDAQALERAPAK